MLTLADTSAKLCTGTRFQVSSNVSPETLPGGLAGGVNYFWDALTPTTCRVATSLANARSQTYVNLTSAGSGTQTLALTSASMGTQTLYPILVTPPPQRVFRIGFPTQNLGGT